ncbi:hypothetical protein GE09DRAFT_1193785 [Coniochaeta sp. 2T2.1]|nr:hypothetical protein GE09DRAFT_1193785 [Coniochaeta sp. 2T2.1]
MPPSRQILCPLSHTSCLLALGFTIIRQHKTRPPNLSLIKLPLELIQEIASYLSVEDVGSLRLMGKAVETAVFDVFVHRFFKTKQFRMLEESSRQILDEISRHPVFSKALENLILATETELLYEAEHHCYCYDCDDSRMAVSNFGDNSDEDTYRDSDGDSDTSFPDISAWLTSSTVCTTSRPFSNATSKAPRTAP